MLTEHTTFLDTLPNIKKLMLKVPFKKSASSSTAPSLPQGVFQLDELVIDGPKSRLFHKVVNWYGQDSIHPCYMHSLAFPVHILLLLQPSFPFPLLGLVHIDNQIRQFRPLNYHDKLKMRCCFGELRIHPKGWLFSIDVQIFSEDELVWQSTSTNLYRHNHNLSSPQVSESTPQKVVELASWNWQLQSNLGRKYAGASGDFNPIHLSKWLAKLFGFNRHIIHGMWTKSRCISALEQYNSSWFSQAFEINSAFKQPLYLPNQTRMTISSEQKGQGLEQVAHVFKVESQEKGAQIPYLHLAGDIKLIHL